MYSAISSVSSELDPEALYGLVEVHFTFFKVFYFYFTTISKQGFKGSCQISSLKFHYSKTILDLIANLTANKVTNI